MALGSDVHLYNAEAGVASTLCSLTEDDYVTSLSWSADGRHLAIGTYSHQVGLFEISCIPLQNKFHTNCRFSRKKLGNLYSSKMHLSPTQPPLPSCLQVQLWDCNREKQVRTLLGHSARVSALAWNRSTLSSGGRDTSILNHDVR